MLQHPRRRSAPSHKCELEPELPPTPPRPSKLDLVNSDPAQGEQGRLCATGCALLATRCAAWLGGPPPASQKDHPPTRADMCVFEDLSALLPDAGLDKDFDTSLLC